MSKVECEARIEVFKSFVSKLSLVLGDGFLCLPLKLTLGLDDAEVAGGLEVGSRVG